MADPEVDWGVDDDFDPWAHPDPDAAQPTSGQGRDNPPSEVHVAVGTATHSERTRQAVKPEEVNGATTSFIDNNQTPDHPITTWVTLSSHSHLAQPYYVNLSTLQTSWTPPSPNDLIHDLTGITTPPLSNDSTNESIEKPKRGVQENGKNRPLIERLAPLPVDFKPRIKDETENGRKEVVDQQVKGEDQSPSQVSPRDSTAPIVLASTSTTASEPPRTISPPNTTTTTTIPPRGPTIPLRDRLTLPDSYRPDSPSSTRPVVVRGDSYRPGVTDDRSDRDRGRDIGRESSRDIRVSDRGRSRDNSTWYDRSRNERSNASRRNSRSRSADTHRPRIEENRRDGMDRIRDRPPHDLRSGPGGMGTTGVASEVDIVIARDRRGQPLVTRRIDAPPSTTTNNAPNRVGTDRPMYLDRSTDRSTGVQNRAPPPPSMPRNPGQPSFPMGISGGRPPSGPSMGASTSQSAPGNRWGPRGPQGPPATNGSNVAATSAGPGRAARWSMNDSAAQQRVGPASTASGAFSPSAAPAGRDSVEKRRGDDMGRDESIKRARVEDGRRDDPRAERQFGGRSGDDPSPYNSQGISTEQQRNVRPQFASTDQHPAGPPMNPARAVFVHPSRQLHVPPATQGAPSPRREDSHMQNVPRGPANFQQSHTRPPPFNNGGPRRGGPPAENMGPVPSGSSNPLPVAPRDARGRAAY